MPLYRDPTLPRARPTLIPALLSIPATAGQHQHENQATAVLAWLADRSDAFARALASLFLGPHDVLERETPIGTRTQVSLKKPGGGAVFPDLSIEAAGRALHVLVEVKVGSAFSTGVLPDGSSIDQPELYRVLWRGMPEEGEARVRAVATLTRAGSDMAPDLSRLRGNDVSWSEVRTLLHLMLQEGDFRPELRLVAESFKEAITTQIAVDPPDATTLATWIAAVQPFVDQVAAEVAELLGGTVTPRSAGSTYAVRRVRIDDRRGVPLFVRLYASPSGTDLNLPGHPDAFIVSIERNPNGILEEESVPAAQAAGFVHTRDVAGYWMHRALRELAVVDGDPVGLAGAVAEQVRTTGLVE